MAGSETEICNRALRAIGAERISSLDDAGTNAIACRDEYGPCRDEVLRAHPWNFAMTRASLAALSEAPAWGWERQFQLPADFVRMWRINGDHATTAFRVESGRILTNQATPLGILYIRRPGVGEFDPIFTSALVARLASALALTLKESTQASDYHMKVYRALLRDARAADAAEGTPEPVWQDAFIEARY